jgi:hypothetical protein
VLKENPSEGPTFRLCPRFPDWVEVWLFAASQKLYLISAFCCVFPVGCPAGDGEVTPAPGIAPRLAAGPSTPAGADIDVQLAQARELKAKLAEEYRTVRLLHASMVGEASARG